MGKTFETKNLMNVLSRMNDDIRELKARRIANRQIFITVGTVLNGDTDFTNIQSAIDYVNSMGGGTVFIRNGTYLLDYDITLYPNVVLIGETTTGVVLDYQNASYNLSAVASNYYDTGTITVVNGSTNVTGTGTNWDVSMEGQTIFIAGIAYIVDTVNDVDDLDIDTIYDGSSFSNIEYAICDDVFGIDILNFTVANSTHASGSVFFNGVSFGNIDGVSFVNSTIGLNFEMCSSVRAVGFDAYYCGDGIKVHNCGGWTFNDWFSYGCTNYGMYIDTMYGASIANFGCIACGTAGMHVKGSEDMGVSDFACNTNTGFGLSVESSVSCEILSANLKNNGSDGIKFIANVDNFTTTAISFKNNGGYGMNVANANCDKNTIMGCHFIGNSSGTINDSGTNTIKANNQT